MFRIHELKDYLHLSSETTNSHYYNMF